MSKKINLYFFILPVIIIILCVNTITYGSKINITKDKAIKIANKEAQKFGYDIKSMIVKATHYDTPWNKYLPKASEDEYHIVRKSKLKNKKYWAVYYSDPKYMFGGDICIFIDSNDGKIITNCRWE